MSSSRVIELERLIPGETNEAIRLRTQITNAIDEAVRARASQQDSGANGYTKPDAHSEARLQMALQAAQAFTWEIDPATGLVSYSSAMAALLSFALPNTLAAFAQFIHPDDRARVMSHFDRAVSGENEIRVDYRLLDPTSGALATVRTQGHLVQTPEKTARVLGITQILATGAPHGESTVGQRPEEGLLARTSEPAVNLDVTARLHRLNARLLASSELAPSLMEVLSATIEVQHADFGTIHLYQTGKRALEIVCHRGVPEMFLKHLQVIEPTSICVTARALTSRSRVVVEDVSRAANFEALRPLAAAAGYRAVHATPMLNRAGEPLGVLTTFFRAPHRLGDHELRLTDLYVAPAAEFINLKLAEQALRSSEARLASIFAQAPVGLCELSIEGRFERVNDQLCQMLGRTRNELLKMGIPEVTHPDHLDASLAAVARLIVTGEPQTLDKRYVRPDRTWIWASSILTRLDDQQGRPQAILAVTIDLTGRRQAERRVRESEERLRLAIEAANVFTWEFDVNTRMMKCSRNVAQVLGIPASSITENDALLLIHPDERERVQEEFGHAVQGDKVFDREFRVMHPTNGQTLWVRSRGQLVSAGDGSPPRMAGVTHNVTAQKIEELKNALLAELQADLIAARDPKEILPALTGKIAAHFQVPRLFFTAINSAAATATVICEHAVGDAEGSGTSSIAESISAGFLHELSASRARNRTIGDADPVAVNIDDYIPPSIASHAYAPYLRDGRWRLVVVATSPQPREWRRDEIELLGELAARIWARLERARAETELRISEEKFRQVSDSGILSIAFFDRRGVLTDANDAFLRMVEYSREDLRSGRLRWADLTPPDWGSRMRQAMEDFEAAGRIAPYEQEYFKRDRSRFWALFGGARLDEHGHGVALLLDVTDRKRAEEALRDSEARLRRAIDIPTVGIVFFNLAGFVTDANDAFLQMTGYTIEDVAERRVRWDLMTPPEWHPRSRRAEEEFKALGQTTPYEKQYIRKNGTRWWALFAATRLSEDEGVEYVIDITERKATEEQLRRYKEDLELRVQERTIELDSINGALREEITERQRAQSARQELLRRLVGAEEEERRRISRELHDEVGQHLAALMLGLKSLDQPMDPAATSETLKALQSITETVGREIHELALELRPTALDDLGLLRTLSNYIDQWSRRANVEVDFHSSGWTGDRLPPHIEATIYRIVQEALTNILKHARATHVSLIVERRPGQVVVIVEDNGTGFDHERLLNQPNRKSIGLLGMKERAALIDGELKIEASPGKGTTVFVRVPLSTPMGALQS